MITKHRRRSWLDHRLTVDQIVLIVLVLSAIAGALIAVWL